MKVEVFHKEWSMGEVSFANWNEFEKYMLRWLNLSVHISFRFEHLQEQTMWFSDLTDLIICAQLSQKTNKQYPWKVTIYGSDKAIRTLNHKAA